ncbi:MAG TPA: malto-oligosyltrehalose trehalohydrolase [Blastocatellia bacterium]|nr:malto-oligosyltrehalose trehalohydrolase [Blastocatellia bacterium]
MKTVKFDRRLTTGAEIIAGRGAHFRLWAPRRHRVEVVIEGGPGFDHHARSFELEAEAPGFFSGLIESAGDGTLYRFRLDDDSYLYPDPTSRFQPEGPHGPSQIVDPVTFEWTDQKWRGVEREGRVVYEMHIGTFTREGTWRSALPELEALADLGINVIEVMPVAEFPGRFGWGYDGVNLFAPTRLYGGPHDFRRFIDRAHALGIGVILDVVYNHLGPDGNYLRAFAHDYFSTRHHTDWGEAINFDGENSEPVREYFLSNAAYWIDEYHLDGLRLDATHCIYDDSADHILAALNRRLRETARGRSVLIVAENEAQEVRLAQSPERGGYGLDILWNDDFHHSAMIAMTGRREAYLTDYLGRPQEFISAIKYGYLYQGQWFGWQKQRRGSADFSLPPSAYAIFIQNHDQVANSGRGERCHLLTSSGRYRAMTALLLLAPGTPMLFQGQEFASSSPFLFFADHQGELGRLVKEGRHRYLTQFRSLATPEMQARLDDPGAYETFNRSKLDLAERETHAETYRLHRDLLRLRREDPIFSRQLRGGVDGAVLDAEAFVLRFFAGEEAAGDRLLFVNLGADLQLGSAPEPLLAPPAGQEWEIMWSTEAPEYGGQGTAALETPEKWLVPGHAAVVLKPRPKSS